MACIIHPEISKSHLWSLKKEFWAITQLYKLFHIHDSNRKQLSDLKYNSSAKVFSKGMCKGSYKGQCNNPDLLLSLKGQGSHWDSKGEADCIGYAGRDTFLSGGTSWLKESAQGESQWNQSPVTCLQGLPFGQVWWVQRASEFFWVVSLGQFPWTARAGWKQWKFKGKIDAI